MIFGLTVPNTFAFTITNAFAFTITNAQVVREDKDWERRAGMILEVKLRNFMCHEVTRSLAIIVAA